ncbi:MAG: hypothetical protein WBF19_12040 [Candidatus Cybelea sp.]
MRTSCATPCGTRRPKRTWRSGCASGPTLRRIPINQTLRRIRPKHAQDEAYFRSVYAETLAQDPELQFIVDIIEADDRRLFST